ncbi:MAG: EAL domain-containing protein [Sulfurospirillaceae bacterium]|nr:EAL domain-containing protein [Sulfurospirillaceae bacterium]
MKTIKIQRLAFYGFFALLLGSIISGTMLIRLLLNYETIKEQQQSTKSSYEALSTFKYNTEHLLVTTNLLKDAQTWHSSFAIFKEHFTKLHQLEFANSDDLENLVDHIEQEMKTIDTQLKNPLFSDKNIMEKSLLRRLGEGLNTNETSLYYIAIRNLSNSIDFLQQYENFLLKELQYLDELNQKMGNEKLDGTKQMLIAVPLVAFFTTLLVGIILWYMIGKIELKLQNHSKTLDYIAHHDHLTKLANRAQFIEKLEKTLHEARLTKGLHVGLIFMDLDRFKEINDSFGHSVGDMVLCEIAKRLTECIPADCLISRLGGDEFTVIVQSYDNKPIEKIARSMVWVSQQPILVKETEIYLTCSIGISLFPLDANDAESMLRNADTAMYQAKDEGKNNFKFYNQAMTEASIAKVQMESHLRKAIEKGEFSLHYQPQIDIITGSIIGSEVLLRWRNETLGDVSPAIFIPLAEETTMIFSIGNWVLEEAFKQQAQWIQAGLHPGLIAINIASKQIYHTDLVSIITTLLQKYALDPHMIELEITERIIVENPTSAIHILNTLRTMGIRISIDDFGTGYSSLSYLKQLPIDKIKIDQSFIRGIPEQNDDAQIVSTIIHLAYGLGLSVIAEGVETQAQCEFLKASNCREIQGYLYSKPLSAKNFEQFLTHFTLQASEKPSRIFL